MSDAVGTLPNKLTQQFNNIFTTNKEPLIINDDKEQEVIERAKAIVSNDKYNKGDLPTIQEIDDNIDSMIYAVQGRDNSLIVLYPKDVSGAEVTEKKQVPRNNTHLSKLKEINEKIKGQIVGNQRFKRFIDICDNIKEYWCEICDIEDIHGWMQTKKLGRNFKLLRTEDFAILSDAGYKEECNNVNINIKRCIAAFAKNTRGAGDSTSVFIGLGITWKFILLCSAYPSLETQSCDLFLGQEHRGVSELTLWNTIIKYVCTVYEVIFNTNRIHLNVGIKGDQSNSFANDVITFDKHWVKQYNKLLKHKKARSESKVNIFKAPSTMVSTWNNGNCIRNGSLSLIHLLCNTMEDDVNILYYLMSAMLDIREWSRKFSTGNNNNSSFYGVSNTLPNELFNDVLQYIDEQGVIIKKVEWDYGLNLVTHICDIVHEYDGDDFDGAKIIVLVGENGEFGQETEQADTLSDRFKVVQDGYDKLKVFVT